MRTTRSVVFVVALCWAASASAQDCTYRPWAQTATPWANKLIYQALGTGTNYDASVWNDWAYYRGLTTPDPPAFTPPWYTHYRFLKQTDNIGTLLVQYYEQARTIPASEAVIVLHGSGLYPDAWFSDSPISQSWGANYTNFGGSDLYAEGYDVFAPYLTHVGPLNAQVRRLAAGDGDEVFGIDLKRALLLFAHLKTQGYTRIYFVGVSYGGWIAVEAARALGADPVLGGSLAIEGWLPSNVYWGTPSDGFLLTSSNWEMTFTPATSAAAFLDLPASVQVAYGSCNASLYVGPYAALPAGQVITYTGAHEFLWSVWQTARGRW